MRNRYLVLGLSAFLALALAVPAMGGPGNPVSSGATALKDTASKALKKARAANSKAKAAQASADAAQNTADKAVSDAKAAQTTANGAQTSANNAKTAADAAKAAADAAQASANTAQATADSKFGSVSNVEGAASPSDNSNKSLVLAGCPTGTALAGGGYIVSGAGGVDAVPQLNSAYLQAWAVTALDQGTNGSNWSITASARCLD
jgi:multidrug efflux pump subunit AcrA (membrane-fusion protein)